MAQTIPTQSTPNGGFFSFTLAPGASTSPIALPLTVPYHVTAAVTTNNEESVGEVDLLPVITTANQPILEWIGLNGPPAGTVTSGDSSLGGNPIVAISYDGKVVLQGSNTTNTFVVTNNSTTLTHTGYVMWMGFSTSILTPTNIALGTGAFENYLLNFTGPNSGYNGTSNTVTGYFAGFENGSGSNNTISGALALAMNASGNGNSAFGYAALNQNLASNNTAIGAGALQNNVSATANTATGYEALAENTTGGNNTASGFEALFKNKSGVQNTALGASALFSNTGGLNTAVGYSALKATTSGKSNVALGWEAGIAVTTGSNNIDINNPGEAADGVAADSGVIRIGTPTPTALQTDTYIAGIYNVTSLTSGLAVFVDSMGHLGTASSSERFKTGIEPMGSNSTKLQQLRPVTFRYKADSQGTLRYGLIAEEVATVYPELVVRDENGRIDGVRYDELAPMLLNEMQQMQKAAGEQAQANAVQAAKIDDLTQQIAELNELKQELRSALLQLQDKNQVVAQR